MDRRKPIATAFLSVILIAILGPSAWPHEATTVEGTVVGVVEFTAPPSCTLNPLPDCPSNSGSFNFITFLIAGAGTWEGTDFAGSYDCPSGGSRSGTLVADTFGGSFDCTLIAGLGPLSMHGSYSGSRTATVVTFSGGINDDDGTPHDLDCAGHFAGVPFAGVNTGVFTGNCTIDVL